MEKHERGKLYYLGMSFVAPGVAHFALGRWLRGLIFFFLSLIAFFWGVWEILRPLIVTVANFLNGPGQDARFEEIGYMYFIRISIALLALVIVWGWSIYDAMKILKQSERTNDGEDENGKKED